jgi:hypothetical protein
MGVNKQQDREYYKLHAARFSAIQAWRVSVRMKKHPVIIAEKLSALQDAILLDPYGRATKPLVEKGVSAVEPKFQVTQRFKQAHSEESVWIAVNRATKSSNEYNTLVKNRKQVSLIVGDWYRQLSMCYCEHRYPGLEIKPDLLVKLEAAMINSQYELFTKTKHYAKDDESD